MFDKLALRISLLAIFINLMFMSELQAAQLDDADVRQKIIQESIYSYPSNCPCPYNLASNGSRCGGRSAYSRGGGYSPLCYPQDVTNQMIENYRARHANPR